ncbi:MAG: hypothetical protein HY770_01300 [Chitinivibrionia bacterium]|nr:hypothetical protein [Chitinivibrionia bacterium]
MGLEFLDRVRKTSIILGLVAAPFVALHLGFGWGGAWLAGIAWSLANLHFIAGLMKHVLTREKRNLTKIILLGAVKFPVLYAAGFLLMRSGVFPIPGLLAGFLWPFFVTTMKALGRMALRLDEPVGVAPRNEAGAFLENNS